MKQLNKHRTRSLLLQLLCFLSGFLAVFPLIYAVLVSFMSPSDIYTTDLIIIPSGYYVQNYETVFSRVKLWNYLVNSLVVSSICSVVRVLCGAMAAYAFEFINFRGKKVAFYLLISSSLIPQEVLFTQNYVTISNLGLVNTYAGVCSVYLVSALCILILCQTFASYPKSIRDAAFLDRCGSAGFFFKILLPTSIPTLTAVYFTSFVSLWNIYLWPLVVTNSNEMRTMQVAITMLKGRDSPDFGPVMAATTISLIPAVLFFVASRSISKRNHIEFQTNL